MKPLYVVGAGSAGAVIAARVSEAERHEVILLEAGPDYRAAELPGDLLDGTKNSTEKHDWRYRFVANSAHDPVHLPRGRVTGGSSAVNTCIALRGQDYDYDEWAEHGGDHWRFAHCLPYFKRLENDLDFDNEWHGNEGPIAIRRHPPEELVPVQRGFLAACERLGMPKCSDHNDPNQSGAGPHAMNKVEGRRISTALGYLEPARGRRNLVIQAHTHVARVLVARGRVTGLELLRDGQLERVECDRVVLAAGAVATPGILMRSGIGPREVLDPLGIDVVKEAPVGVGLLDHPGAAVIFAPEPGANHPSQPDIQCTMRYTPEGGKRDEMQLQPVSVVRLPGVPLVFAFTVVVGKTASEGWLRIHSTDPRAKPHIEAKLGEHARDRDKIREGLALGRRVADTPEMKALGRVVWPTAEQLTRSDTRWMLSGIGSGYHPCATVRMGPGGVVDGHGRVPGIEGLIVADASIMPTIPSSNLNLGTIMIGERFGEWLRDGEL